jgi:hypothetical protein
LALALSTVNVRAARITVDPDAFGVGADISHAFAGVTLSAFGSGNLNGPDVSTPQVFSRLSPFASTGNRVFGNSSYSNLWFNDSAEFRVDFLAPTSFVSLDLIADDGFDPSVMRAFNSAGALLAESAVTGAAGVGVAETALIERNDADIAFVIATNPAGMAGQQFLIDQLVYELRDDRLRPPEQRVDRGDLQPIGSTRATTHVPEPWTLSLVVASFASMAAPRTLKGRISLNRREERNNVAPI